MVDPATRTTRTLPRLLAAALLLLIILGGLGTATVRSFLAEEADYNRSQDILARTRDADRLVMVELESIRAASGRYPATLPAASTPRTFEWNYRPTEDGSDYELWCVLPGKGGAFDALVFSPDGVVCPDWPSAEPVPGTAWSIIPHAERAPADLLVPRPPPGPGSPTVR